MIRKMSALSANTVSDSKMRGVNQRIQLTRLGLKLCGPHEEIKVWSQNLGHEDLITTMVSYGKLSNDSQAEIMRRFGATEQNTSRVDLDLAEQLRAMATRLEATKNAA